MKIRIAFLITIAPVWMTACASSQLRNQKVEIENLQAQLDGQRTIARRTASEEAAKIKELQAALDAEKSKNQVLEEKLSVFQSTSAVAGAIPISELLIEPEKYENTEVTTEGVLANNPYIIEPMGTLQVCPPGINCGDDPTHTLYCYFKTKELSIDSRRLLWSKRASQTLRLRGRFINAEQTSRDLMLSGVPFHPGSPSLVVTAVLD